jgi:hypothetical protein
MKKIYVCLILLIFSHQSFAQLSWGTPITVTTGSGANLHPRIALNRNGDPYVLWGQTDTKALFAKWNGSAFTTPVAPAGALQVFAQSWAGPDMAAFGDTVYVVMKRTPETTPLNHMYLVRSVDGGVTFSDTVRIDNYDTNVTRFPVVTTDDAGNPVVAFMRFNSTFGSAKYVTSSSADHGSTFGTPVLASIGMADVCDCCPASVIANGAMQAVLFRNNVSNIRDNWVALSTNSGANYATNRVIDTTSWMIMSCPSSGPDGFLLSDTLYAVFMSGASGSSRVYMSKTGVGVMASNTEHNAITGPVAGVTNQNYPRIANEGSKAVAVWKQSSAGSSTVAYSYTNDITGGLAGYYTIPGSSGVENADVAISGNYVHVVWQDNNSGKVMYARGAISNVGLDQVAPVTEIAIYPNAASDQFSVDIPGGGITNAALVDNSGREFILHPETSASRATFYLDRIAPGNYIFHMTSNAGQKFTSKILIVK